MKFGEDIFYFVLLALPALAVGGVHTSIVVVFAGLVWAFWGLMIWDRRGRKRTRLEVTVPSLAFWLFGAVCLLQIVPVPLFFHHFVSPESARVFEATAGVLTPDASLESWWRPMSMAVGETADRGLRWLALGMLAVVAAHRRARDREWRRTLWVATAVGGVVFLAGLVQTLADSGQILFVYEPEASIEPLSTFVSPNHGAVFFGLAALAAFALALRSFPDKRVETFAGALVGAAAAMAMFEQRSVGATFGFLLATGIVSSGAVRSFRTRWRLDSDTSIRRILLGVAVAVVVLPALVAAFWAWGPTSVQASLADTSFGTWLADKGRTRLELVRAGFDLVGDFPVAGIGAGATGDVVPMYIDWSVVNPASIPTIEVEPLEWLFQFGLPVGLVGGVLIASYLGFLGRDVRSSTRFRYVVGFGIATFFAVNSLMHFPWLALGTAVPAVFVIDWLAGRGGMRQPRERPWYRRGVVEVSRHFEMAVWGATAVAAGFLTVVHFAGPAADLGQSVEQPMQRRPADAELSVRVADAFREAGRIDEAAAAMELAYQLEPHARMALRRAAFLARVDRTDEAVEWFARVFEPGRYALPGPQLKSWVRGFLVPSLREPEPVARALADAPLRIRELAVDEMRRQGGEGRGLDLAVALTGERPDSFAAYRLVVDSALELEQPLLAEMWARQLLDRDLDEAGADGRRGHLLLARALRAGGDKDGARRVVLQRVLDDERGGSERVGLMLIALAPNEPASASDRWGEATRLVLETHCRQPETRWKRHRCWQGRAWLDERNGDLESAEYGYLRLARTRGQYTRAARFYARTGQCTRLNEKADEWRTKATVDDDQDRRLEAIAEDCAAPDSSDR